MCNNDAVCALCQHPGLIKKKKNSLPAAAVYVTALLPFSFAAFSQAQLYLQAGTLAVHLCVQISRLNALTTEVQLKVKYINSH